MPEVFSALQQLVKRVISKFEQSWLEVSFCVFNFSEDLEFLNAVAIYLEDVCERNDFASLCSSSACLGAYLP